MVLGKYSTCKDVIAELKAASPQPYYVATSTTIITGSNTGIGKKAAQELAYLGSNVVLAVRDVKKGAIAIEEILRDKPNDVAGELRITCLECDLNSLASVQRFVAKFTEVSAAENWPDLRCLILNAGIFAFDLEQTMDGFEKVFGVNHLGHFHLSKLLLPELRRCAPSRVVVVSSNGHKGKVEFDFSSKDDLEKYVVHPTKKDFGSFTSYKNSKICNVLFAQELHNREAVNGVAACSLHPGDLIATDIGRSSIFVSFFIKYIYSWFTKSVDQGTSTTIYCSLLPHEELQGKYFDNCSRANSGVATVGEAGNRAAKSLWDLSESLISRAKL